MFWINQAVQGIHLFIYPGPWERGKGSQDQELDLVCIQTAMTLA